MKSVFEFAKSVQREARHVHWPSRSEVLMTTGFVFLMVCLFSIFFLGVDTLIASCVQWLLGG